MSARAQAVAAMLAAVIFLAAASTAGAEIIFDGRWNAPGLGNWDETIFQKAGNANRLDYVRAPRRPGSNYSADLLVGGNAASERIVFLKTVFADAEGKDDWWAWSVYIHANSDIPNSVFLVSLFTKFNASVCGARGPANSLYMVNPDPSRPADRWRYVLAGGKGTCHVRYVDIAGLRVVKQRWIDFSCHFHWSSAPAGASGTGVSQCWYRAQPSTAWTPAFHDSGPNLVSTNGVPGTLSVHYGLYKPEAAPYTHFDLGGLVVADTRHEAERAAFGAPGTPAPPSEPSTGPSVLLFVAVGGVAAVALALLARMLHGGRHRRLRHHGPAS
jgi:hypothetical protein